MNKKEILIVDDDNLTLEYLSSFLMEKYKIYVVRNYKEALNLIENKYFDAFLLDINLQENKNTGINLCQQIKKNHTNSLSPVIFITSSDKIDFIEEGFAAGAVDYVIKPFNLQELAIRLNIHISNVQKHKTLINEYNTLIHENELILKELNSSKNKIEEQQFINSEEKFKIN